MRKCRTLQPWDHKGPSPGGPHQGLFSTADSAKGAAPRTARPPGAVGARRARFQHRGQLRKARGASALPGTHRGSTSAPRLRPSSPNSAILPRGKRAAGPCMMWSPGPGYTAPRIRSHSIHRGGANTGKGQGILTRFSLPGLNSVCKLVSCLGSGEKHMSLCLAHGKGSVRGESEL